MKEACQSKQELIKKPVVQPISIELLFIMRRILAHKVTKAGKK
jgi:hypothetical protein